MPSGVLDDAARLAAPFNHVARLNGCARASCCEVLAGKLHDGLAGQSRAVPAEGRRPGAVGDAGDERPAGGIACESRETVILASSVIDEMTPTRHALTNRSPHLMRSALDECPAVRSLRWID